MYSAGLRSPALRNKTFVAYGFVTFAAAAMLWAGAQWQGAATGGAPGAREVTRIEVVPPIPQKIDGRTVAELGRAPGVLAVAPVRTFEGRVFVVDGQKYRYGQGGTMWGVAPPPAYFALDVGALPPATHPSKIVLTAASARSLGIEPAGAVDQVVFLEVRRGPYREQLLAITLTVAGLIGDGVIRGVAIVTPNVADVAARWMSELATSADAPEVTYDSVWVYAESESAVVGAARALGLRTLPTRYTTR